MTGTQHQLTATRLKLMRQRLGISQSKAAALLGTGLRTYQGWEAGKQMKATPEIIDILCSALESTPP